MTKLNLYNICMAAKCADATLVIIYNDGSSMAIHTTSFDYVSAPNKRRYISFCRLFDKTSYCEINEESVYQINIICK